MKLALSLCASLFPLVTLAAPYVPNQVLVKYGNYGKIQYYMAAPRFGSNVISYNKSIGWYLLALPRGSNVKKVVQQLLRSPGVVSAEPNYIQTAQFVPTDPDYPQQYAPGIMGMQSAWNYTLGLQAEVIAVVDTGIQLSHPEFANRLDIIQGANFVTPSATPDDDNGHGTHVAGIIGAGVDNGIGIAGICPSATLMPVKVLDSQGNGTDSNISDGITFAVNNGAQVINMSLGGTDFSSEEQDAINFAANNGVMCVAAAGNSSSNAPFYPAADANIISVAASTATDSLASYSNYGQWVTVVAPGDNILSTYLNSGYQSLSGTSMASAQVSGVLGILQSYAPTNTPYPVLEAALLQGCQGIGTDTAGGRVNAYNSILALNGSGSSSTIDPVSVYTQVGTYLFGDFTSLFSIDQNTYSIETTPMPNLDQRATAVIGFTLLPQASTVTGLSVSFDGYGFQNATNQVFAWDYIHQRYTLIGSVNMNQVSAQGATIQFPSNYKNFIFNGQVQIEISGVIFFNSWPTTPPQFQFNIDEAVLNVSV